VADVVRTKQFFAGITTAGTQTLYTVPAGFTALIKWYQACNTTVASQGITLAMHSALTGSDVSLFRNASVAVNAVLGGATLLVLRPGDTLVVFATASGLQIFASGAELAGVAP
jgi:hypothetical protein